MERAGFGFEILARDGEARAGRLDTPHGSVATPVLTGPNCMTC